jgi:hypothetical protein
MSYSKVNKLMNGATADNPWHHAAKAGREYLTPEDVTAAVAAGGTVLGVAKAVLEAVEAKAAEDASLCAFVALKTFKGRA